MDKRQQWELIKGSAPEVADWMTRLGNAFGKSAAMQVKLLESGEVVESGRFSRGLGLDDKGSR